MNAGTGRRQNPNRGSNQDGSITADLTIACVFIPYFPLRVESVRHPELDGLPLALTDLSAHRRTIVTCSPEATEQGVKVGMSVRDAVNACPHTAILTSDPVHYANVYADLLRSLLSVSPGVQAGNPERGAAWVDLRGLERLYGGLENIVPALLRAIPPAYRPRIGLAATAFTASVAARRAKPGRHHAVPPAFSKAFLGTFPVDVLPVPVEMRRRLERFGLYTLRDIAKLPVGKLQAQFGPDGRRAWELANGIDSEPFRPIGYEERVVERLPLPDPTVQIETVLLAVDQLVRRAFSRQAVRGRAVRQARLQLLLEGNRSWEKVVALKGTIGEPEVLAQTLRYRLMGLMLDGPVVEIVLELAGLTTMYARQEELFESELSLRGRRRREIGEAVSELKQRYGASPLYHLAGIEPWSRIPERRWGLFGYE